MAKKEKKMARRACGVCGKGFAPAVSNQRYCSAKCKATMKAKVAKERRAEIKKQTKKEKSVKVAKPEKQVKPTKVQTVEKIRLVKKNAKKRETKPYIKVDRLLLSKRCSEEIVRVALYALALFKSMQIVDYRISKSVAKGKAAVVE